MAIFLQITGAIVILLAAGAYAASGTQSILFVAVGVLLVTLGSQLATERQQGPPR